MAEDTGERALEDLLTRVKSIVADAGFEADDEALRALFATTGTHPCAYRSGAELQARIEAIPRRVPDQVVAPTTSRLPGGSLAHRLVARVTRRHDQVLLEDIRGLACEVRDRLLEVATTSPTGTPALERVSGQVEAIADAVARMETQVSAAVGRVEAMEERLAGLEAEARSHHYRPWFSSVDFDDEFRGSRKVILDRYHDLADILAATGGPVVDLGCGRGELVELLITRGIEVWGVEMSPELVEFCRSIYLDVRLADAASALEDLQDGFLGGAALIHVVEHVTAQQLVELVALLARKVRPGGVVVAETPNPTSPYVFTHSFYLDPTHSTPVHPSYLAFLFRHAGFADVDVQFRSQVADEDHLVPVKADDVNTELAEQINFNVELLDRLLLGPQDYAVVAVR